MVIDVSVILQSPPFIISGRLVFSISSLCIVSALRERLKSGNAWNVPMRTLPVPIALRTNAKNRSKYPDLVQHARVECLPRARDGGATMSTCQCFMFTRVLY